MRRTVVVLAALVVIVGVVVWRVRADSPPPPVAPADEAARAAIEADPQAADAIGQRILDALDPGECVAAHSLDLGPLAAAGSWSEVCVSSVGTVGGEQAQLANVEAVQLTFRDGRAQNPHTCVRGIEGRWWEWYPAGPDATRPCADGWTFQGA